MSVFGNSPVSRVVNRAVTRMIGAGSRSGFVWKDTMSGCGRTKE